MKMTTKQNLSDLYHDECKLCEVYGQDVRKGTECKVLHVIPSEECPCLFCLIKGICRNTCQDYDAVICHGKKKGLI